MANIRSKEQNKKTAHEEPNKLSKTLGLVKVFQSRVQAYISLFNMVLLMSVWLKTGGGNISLLFAGLLVVIIIGLLDWKFVFRAEQQVYFKNNPEWGKRLNELDSKLDRIENILSEKNG